MLSIQKGSENEALQYAKTDTSKIALARIRIPKEIMKNLDYQNSVDTQIFINGVITVHWELQNLFNNSIISIEIIEGVI